MDLTRYADLAVRLVNTADAAHGRGDSLATTGSVQALVADLPSLSDHVTRADLEPLRQLRAELRLIFAAAAQGYEDEVAHRLNALLTRYPVHPQIVRHDGTGWHIHLVESGCTADKFAAAAVTGLTGVVAQLGADRLGACARHGCERVFVDDGPDRSQLYCSEKCTTKANIRTFRARNQSPRPASSAAS